MNENKIGLNLLFSTPIWSTVLNNHVDLNNGLTDYIHDLKQKNPQGSQRSNINGWHSPDFDLKDNYPSLFTKAITPCINKAIADMSWNKQDKVRITSMWSIINPKGAANHIHTHPNNLLSAAYYVRAPEKCGKICFYDPRPSSKIRYAIQEKTNNLNTTNFGVTPKEGLLVLFPSYLEHSVESNMSDDNRIVISFNVNLFNNELY